MDDAPLPVGALFDLLQYCGPDWHIFVSVTVQESNGEIDILHLPITFALANDKLNVLCLYASAVPTTEPRNDGSTTD